MIKSNYNLEETMEFKGWNDFENLARACGYSSCGKNDNGDKTEDEFENSECRDIPNGFQDVDPQLFILIGEILGNILSGRLPFNVQNALGNWLQLVGQVIETYNAQQQYFQGGPGIYFNPKSYNVSNPFCSSSQNTNSSKNKPNKSTNDIKKKNSEEDMDSKINHLELSLNDLREEIKEIKKLLEK
ncbi:MAG: hypothetical protein LKH93_09195 [Clostridium beijerinckii]|jgi:hypothetical protein|nr:MULTISPECIES: hypothetical protein [Clostridium]ALB46910.2 hypothetical protein X276_17525 [Clostridium beijerinckii NRRL B-598]MCI1577731.1 hypothetical protein [Clostridium beijerinckii]MCI1584427.1 hypothetical protein [Clostridium beijerinckii]MCI1622378.1 hypothetical protein [Clostridium beijerinckii]MDG5855470.1 hypothetical protein [Clostridium beijerinckii]